MSVDRRERVFLVRLWQPAGEPAAPTWRGSVHDVRSGHKRYISVPQEIADFVSLRLAAEDGPEAPDTDRR